MSKLETARAQKLGTEGATAGLATDLANARSLNQAKSDKLDILKVALGMVYDDL